MFMVPSSEHRELSFKNAVDSVCPTEATLSNDRAYPAVVLYLIAQITIQIEVDGARTHFSICGCTVLLLLSFRYV